MTSFIDEDKIPLDVFDTYRLFSPSQSSLVRLSDAMKLPTTTLLLPFLLVAQSNAFPMISPVVSLTARGGTSLRTSQMPFYNDSSDYALDNVDINNILQQNEAYVERMGPKFFEELGSKHEPKYMWIGCADARVPANELMGERPGSVFVARNVANMVVSTDVNLLGALQYAVNVLKVKHIIVCGHYDCGGIRASMTKEDVGPPLEMWLRNLRDVYRVHQEELDAIEDIEERHRRFVELNAIEQCVNLFKTGIIQKQRITTARDPSCKFPAPRIHACVFDPKDGRLKQVGVNFDKYLVDLRDVYEMYQAEVGKKSPAPYSKQSKSFSLRKLFGMGA